MAGRRRPCRSDGDVPMTASGSATRPSLDELRRKSAEARKLIVQAIHTAGAGHLGGPMSATDLLIALYFDQMAIDPDRPDWPERDRFILSKGHSSIALYTVLAMRGYYPVEELKTFDAAHSRLQG